MKRSLIFCCLISLSCCDILRKNNTSGSTTTQVPHVAAASSPKLRVTPLRIPPAPHRSILVRQSQLPDVQQRILPLAPPPPPPLPPPIPPPPPISTHKTTSKTSPASVPQNAAHYPNNKPITTHSSPRATECASIGGVLIHSKEPLISSLMEMYDEFGMGYGTMNPYLTPNQVKLVCQVELRDETQVSTFMMNLRQRMTKFPAFEITIKYRAPDISVGGGGTIGGGSHGAAGVVSGGTAGSANGIGTSAGVNNVNSGLVPQTPSIQSAGQLSQLTSRLESLRAATARQIAELSIRIASIQRQIDDLKRQGSGTSGSNGSGGSGGTNVGTGGTRVTIPDLSGFDDP